MPKNRIRVNWNKASLVFGRLVDALRGKKFPYQYVSPPQVPEKLPKSLPLGGLEEALFLWCVCYYMRGGIKSETAVASLGRFYTNATEFFSPATFVNGEREEWAAKVTAKLRAYGLGFQSKSIGGMWVDNFRKLHRFWEGDPRMIFRRSGSYEELCAHIIRVGSQKFDSENQNGFIGFREKMVSMIAYFLMYAKLVPFCPFPLPVDYHVSKQLVSHGILTSSEFKVGASVLSERLLAIARRVTFRYCQEKGVSPLDLCDALWLLSSSICARHPGNTSVVGVDELRPKTPFFRRLTEDLNQLELFELNGKSANNHRPPDGRDRIRSERKGRKTSILAIPVTWNESQVRGYENSCALCPIETTCRLSIPAAHYYVRGEIFLRSKRQKPPMFTAPLRVDH